MTKKGRLFRTMVALKPAGQDRGARTQAPCRPHPRCARLRAVDGDRRAVDVGDGAQAQKGYVKFGLGEK